MPVRVGSTKFIMENLLDIKETALSSPDRCCGPVFLDGLLCHPQIIRVARIDQVAQFIQAIIDVAHGARLVPVGSLMRTITNQSVDELGIKAGDKVTAVIKASEVMIGVD
jgi:molybdopterin-binding protein